MTEAERHLSVGLSYLVNRFDAMPRLPDSVVVLGGRHLPTHAPPEMIADHLREAEKHFTRAMELDPGLREAATSNLAAVRLAEGEYGAAIAYVEELMQASDRSDEPLLKQHLGTAYREMGQYDTALQLFRSIAGGEPSLLHRNIALTHLNQDDVENAEEEMREQRRRHDSSLDRLLTEGIEAELRGDAEEARRAYAEIASACRYDGLNQLLGKTAARRSAKLMA
jgi:tetratricopeptide (TPR) repeat protein